MGHMNLLLRVTKHFIIYRVVTAVNDTAEKQATPGNTSGALSEEQR